jgi:hypothetical protein
MCDIQSARQVSFLSVIPSHVIDHLTAMCLPHGFVVIDHNCFQLITTFVGFLVCPLLETKHGPCTVHFLYIACPPPLRTLQPKVSDFLRYVSLYISSFPSLMPMPPMSLLSSLIYSLYLLRDFLSGSLTWLYMDPSIRELFSISGPPGNIIIVLSFV